MKFLLIRTPKTPILNECIFNPLLFCFIKTLTKNLAHCYCFAFTLGFSCIEFSDFKLLFD